MKILISGSFDPPTTGHFDLIKRASDMVGDTGIVAIVIFRNSAKNYMFSEALRHEMLLRLAAYCDNITVDISELSVADYFKQNSFDLVLRGARNAQDFTYEQIMAEANRNLAPELTTVILPARSQLSWVSSSIAREFIRIGEADKAPVPEEIKDLL